MSCYTEALHRTQRAKRDEKSKRKQHKSNEEKLTQNCMHQRRSLARPVRNQLAVQVSVLVVKGQALKPSTTVQNKFREKTGNKMKSVRVKRQQTDLVNATPRRKSSSCLASTALGWQHRKRRIEKSCRHDQIHYQI